ncbi:MAG: DUF6772 family protein [Candidatus Latescibacterota bacterium]|nr:DUF6772 family protein [Candidatus Latescibacterota bacterium]
MSDTNPKLSRFSPLSRIITFDDFDKGLNGWTNLVGNYEGSLDTMLPQYRDLRGPMLSNGTMWDTGSAGSWDGTYAMKLATKPHAGSLGVAVKRLTWRELGKIQVEAYVTFKPEATEMVLSELDVRAFGFVFDLQDSKDRVMPHLRYLNAVDGEQIGQWQSKSHRELLEEIGGSGKTKSHFHLAGDGWENLSGERQLLCYNEIATKQNWHYLRMTFNLKDMSFVGFQFNDRRYDVSGIAPMVMPAMANLWCMLNLVFFVETDIDKRAFLSVDSVLLSGSF